MYFLYMNYRLNEQQKATLSENSGEMSDRKTDIRLNQKKFLLLKSLKIYY